jgi:DNA repair protein SbcC/Rad50
MIPVKLELYNFLAYCRPEPLDLTGLHLACLAGANGAGKTSLLDAITWSLWGRARSQRDDELIHGDEAEMSVQLTFLLDGTLYRVMRYRSKKGRGQTDLILEIQDGETWRSIGENTIRATQEKIIRLLRLDYQTFINSAFLMQGRADEFTTKSPGERKSILGEILGLDAWVMYEDRTKQRIKQMDQQSIQIDAQLDSIQDELQRETEYHDELTYAQSDLEALLVQVREAEEYTRQMDTARHERDSLTLSHSDAQRQAQQAEMEMSRIEGERGQHIERLGRYEQALSTREEIEKGYAALKNARLAEREMGDRLLEQADLFRHRSELQQAITTARLQLEGEQSNLRSRKSDFERVIAEAVNGHTLPEVEAQIAELEAREGERELLRLEHDRCREERAGLEGQNRSLKAEMDAIVKQRDQIAAVTDPLCPLCGQDLSEDHRADLVEKLSNDGKQRGDQYRANQQQIEALRSEEARVTQTLQAFEQDLRKLPPLREHLTRLSERTRRADDAAAEIENISTRLAEVEATLWNQSYLRDDQAMLAEVEADLAAVGYDEEAHQQARSSITEYEPFEARKAELDRALAGAPEAEAAIASLDQQSSVWNERYTEACTRIDTLNAQIEDLNQKLMELAHWEAELSRLRDLDGQARYRVGAAEQKLKALDQQRIRRAQLTTERDQLNEERAIFDELRGAFGKDGVPAMIIEAAIPEIEMEANEMLVRMTDGRMHVRFDTQREKVTGGIKETLDIKIADELGTRDYATFSGGEAFRVNFAIRLALSRLLARRAGAQLRTLIIDEGFGTQDAQGRERLVQAINAIQDEFDLILVITHIDELKDAFPARIEITKTLEGSQIELV